MPKQIKLSKLIPLRAEVGLDTGYWGVSFYPENEY